MTQLPRRQATTIVLLLLMSGAGGAFYSHSTASERSSGASSGRRTAAGLRGVRTEAPAHPLTDGPTNSGPSHPSVSPAVSPEQFNRTVFGAKPKAGAAIDTTEAEQNAATDQVVPVGRQEPRRIPAEMPAILPVEPHQVARQPTPQLPAAQRSPEQRSTLQLPAPQRQSDRTVPPPPTPTPMTLGPDAAAPQIISQPSPAAEIVPMPTSRLPDELADFKPPTLTSIGATSIEIAPEGGDLPPDFAALAQRKPQDLAPPGELPRSSAPFYSTPRVADFTHRPLYFEEKALERNGRTIGLAQPVASFVHFFGTIPALPYKMGEKPPSTPMYTGNGINLPSDHATVRQRVRGVMTAAGVAVGLSAALP